MCQEPAADVHALGRPIDQTAAKLQDPGRATKSLLPGSAQKVHLQLYGHGRVGQTQPGLNRQPHRYVGRSHKDLAAYNASGPLECLLKRHMDSALALFNAFEPKTQIPREGYVVQQPLKFIPAACKVHGNSVY